MAGDWGHIGREGLEKGRVKGLEKERQRDGFSRLDSLHLLNKRRLKAKLSGHQAWPSSLCCGSFPPLFPMGDIRLIFA